MVIFTNKFCINFFLVYGYNQVLIGWQNAIIFNGFVLKVAFAELIPKEKFCGHFLCSNVNDIYIDTVQIRRREKGDKKIMLGRSSKLESWLYSKWWTLFKMVVENFRTSDWFESKIGLYVNINLGKWSQRAIPLGSIWKPYYSLSQSLWAELFDSCGSTKFQVIVTVLALFKTDDYDRSWTFSSETVTEVRST